MSTNREIEKRGRVVGVDITVQKNKLQKYKKNKLQTTRTQKKLDLVTDKENKHTNKNKNSLEYKTSSQHMKQRKTDAKRNIGQLHSSHIKGISCF